MAANSPAMIPVSPTEDDFRTPGRGTLTAAPLPPQLGDSPKVNPKSFTRPEPDDEVETATVVSTSTGTFASSQSFGQSSQGFKPPSTSGRRAPDNGFGGASKTNQSEFSKPATSRSAFNPQAPPSSANRGFSPPTGASSSNGNALRPQTKTPQASTLGTPPSIRTPAANSSYYNRRGSVAAGSGQGIETRSASALPPDTGARTSIPPNSNSQTGTDQATVNSSGNTRLPSQTLRTNQRFAALPAGATPAPNALRQPAAQPPQRPVAESAFPNRPTTRQTPTANLAQINTAKPERQALQTARQQFAAINQAPSEGLTGSSVQLTELFNEPLSGDQRKQMTAQYWETYYDLTAVKIAADHQAWLAKLKTAPTPAEQGLLDAAKRVAADQKLAAEIQLSKAQSRLMDYMPTPRSEGYLPIPADQPLIGEYKTDYDKYKRIRNLPSSLRGIDNMLARTINLIAQRSQTVSAAKTAADQAQSAAANRQTPLASALAAGQLWRDSRLDLVASAVSYNQAISDYILTVEPYRPPAQLSALMIGAPRAPATTMPQVERGFGMNQPVRSAQNPNANSNSNFGGQPRQPRAPIQFR